MKRAIRFAVQLFRSSVEVRFLVTMVCVLVIAMVIIVISRSLAAAQMPHMKHGAAMYAGVKVWVNTPSLGSACGVYRIHIQAPTVENTTRATWEKIVSEMGIHPDHVTKYGCGKGFPPGAVCQIGYHTY